MFEVSGVNQFNYNDTKRDEEREKITLFCTPQKGNRGYWDLGVPFHQGPRAFGFTLILGVRLRPHWVRLLPHTIWGSRSVTEIHVVFVQGAVGVRVIAGSLSITVYLLSILSLKDSQSSIRGACVHFKFFHCSLVMNHLFSISVERSFSVLKTFSGSWKLKTWHSLYILCWACRGESINSRF